VINEIVQSDI